MSEHYDFHYQPTGSGAISGQQVLEQTEDAINELGDYVYDNVGGAMDVAQEALETAQNAQNDAQTALDTANSFSSAIQSAQQDASTALSTAQTAQTTASNANNTAIQAQQDASSAVTTANNASGQVSTLSGTVTTLGQRVTTAEGNIGQNTNDITALTTRVGTAEGNITTLQNDVTIAQGNASSAMATAGQVKQQAFVFRYSSTALVASSTNSNALLDNTDNLKVGDKVIDSNGVLFSITAIDTANSTFTIGTALVDLAQDSDVVHKSGNETISGYKTLSNNVTLYNSSASVNPVALFFKNKKVAMGSTTNIGSQNIAFRDSADTNLSILKTSCESVGNTSFEISVYNKDSNNQTVSGGMLISQTPANTYITPTTDNAVLFGSTNRRWSKIYGTEYYYGSNNVEFSTKFVTTDTAQTITGSKTFSSNVNVYNSDNTADTPNIILKNSKAEVGTEFTEQSINFVDKNNNALAKINCYGSGGNYTRLYITAYDSNNNSDGFFIRRSPAGTTILPTTPSAVAMGNPTFPYYNVQTNRVNNVEPSSLSLPSGNVNDIIDISSYLTDLTGSTANTYIAPANGWISITMSNSSGIQAYITGLWGHQIVRPSVGGVRFLMPILKDKTANILIFNGTIDNAKFIPCQGNV